MRAMKVKMSSRKEQYRNSQKKLREVMKEEGKVPISDYVLSDTKKKLVHIQKKNSFRRIGDAIDEVLREVELDDIENT